MVGLGMLRSPAALHALGLRTEGHSLSRPCHRSKDGGAAWFGSLQSSRREQPWHSLGRSASSVLRYVQWKHCRAARLPSSQPRARRPSGTSSLRAPCRRQFLGVKRGRKSGFSENDCGFVELIPGLHHHAKGSSFAHSGGRWERFINTFRTEVVVEYTSRSGRRRRHPAAPPAS